MAFTAAIIILILSISVEQTGSLLCGQQTSNCAVVCFHELISTRCGVFDWRRSLARGVGIEKGERIV